MSPVQYPLSMPEVKHELIDLVGGLDLVTPTLKLKPGVLRDSQNFEVSVTGGYSRIAGYERFDGRTSPSAASYGTVVLSAVTGLAVGDAINGQTSGATAVVAFVDGLTVVYTKAVGTFQLAENMREGVTVIGTITSLSAVVTDPKLSAQYTNYAADIYRADILAVPGSGPVRGVSYFGGTVYAWRNNAGGTALVMHRSTAGGWAAVSLGFELSFNTGLPAGIVDGDTVTGLTSGASGVVTRVVLESGTFAASTAAGRLIFASVAGTFQLGEFLRVGGTNRATSGGAQAAITLLPDGRVLTDQGSFGGSLAGSAARMYGADSVNRGFEFDGTVYVPIRTGMTVDRPQKVKVHQKHLFFTFGSSIQHSGIGSPYAWTPVLGAAELLVDDVVTDWLEQPGAQTTGALVIYTRSNTYVLYGTSSATWNLTTYQADTGALPFTGQTMASAYVLDDRGVIELATSQAYGNFTDATLTANIRPWIQTRRNRAVASAVNREKSQYRLFFSDGYALYTTIVNGKLRGCMPVVFPDIVTCAANGETPDGAETAFIGSSNGFVYRLDVGTSFDGQAIAATMLLNFAPQGDSRYLKHYRHGNIEITGSSYAEIMVGYNLAYADATKVDQGVDATYMNNFSAPFWDTFIWDAFVWDGLSLSPSDIDIQGSAENIAIRISSSADYFEAFTLNSLILHYTYRRALR